MLFLILLRYLLLHSIVKGCFYKWMSKCKNEKVHLKMCCNVILTDIKVLYGRSSVSNVYVMVIKLIAFNKFLI